MVLLYLSKGWSFQNRLLRENYLKTVTINLNMLLFIEPIGCIYRFKVAFFRITAFAQDGGVNDDGVKDDGDRVGVERQGTFIQLILFVLYFVEYM